MVGAKGKSGGTRPGAGRTPKPDVETSKKESNGNQMEIKWHLMLIPLQIATWHYLSKVLNSGLLTSFPSRSCTAGMIACAVCPHAVIPSKLVVNL